MRNNMLNGFIVMQPCDVKRMDQLANKLCTLYQAQQYYKYIFPAVGKLNNLEKEKDHLKFTAQVYKLDDNLHYLSPTGEAIMYPIMYNCPRPLKWYSHSTVFRKETTGRPFLRQKQIYYFLEAHSIFDKEQDALNEFDKLVELYTNFFKCINLPVLCFLRTPEETFPGAVKTIAFDTLINGRSLQVGTVHYLGANFAKVYSNSTIYGVCAGITERILGALKLHYASNLNEVDNPYKIVDVNPGHLKTTLKKYAEKKELFFKNKYSYYKGHYRHVKSGVTLSEAEMIVHDAQCEKDAVAEVMSQTVQKTHIFETLTSQFTPYPLGYKYANKECNLDKIIYAKNKY